MIGGSDVNICDGSDVTDSDGDEFRTGAVCLASRRQLVRCQVHWKELSGLSRCRRPRNSPQDTSRGSSMRPPDTSPSSNPDQSKRVRRHPSSCEKQSMTNCSSHSVPDEPTPPCATVWFQSIHATHENSQATTSGAPDLGNDDNQIPIAVAPTRRQRICAAVMGGARMRSTRSTSPVAAFAYW